MNISLVDHDLCSFYLDPCAFDYTKFDDDWSKLTPYFGLKLNLNDFETLGSKQCTIFLSIVFILLEQLELWSPTVTKWVPLKSIIPSRNCGYFSHWPRLFQCHALIENLWMSSYSKFYSELLLNRAQDHRSILRSI